MEDPGLSIVFSQTPSLTYLFDTTVYFGVTLCVHIVKVPNFLHLQLLFRKD